MDKSKIKSIYSKQIFLNPDESPFVDQLQCFSENLLKMEKKIWLLG